MITLITTLEGLLTDINWSGPAYFCPYCHLNLTEEDLPVIKLHSVSATLFIHKNCAVATAARIQNEYDKIEVAPPALPG